MGLDPIPRDTYVDFAKQMFRLGNKTIDNQAVIQVYDMCRGVTWYMQMLLNEMYSLTNGDQPCSVEMIEQALSNVVLIQEPFYREILAALPTKQKSLLFALVKENGAQNITSAAFIQKHKLLSASSVQSAIKGLYEKDIVTEHNDTWYVYDVFLVHYIKKK